MIKVWKILGGIVGVFLGFLLLGFLAVVLKGQYDRRVIADHEAETKVAGFDSTNATLVKRQDSVRTVYRDRWHTYRETRDASIKANPENKALIDLAGECDQLIVSCEARHAIDSALTESQAAEIKLLKSMKEKKPPRFSAYAEAQYDWLNSEPLGRVGAAFRIVGPFSVTAGLEGGPNRNGESQTRGTVGARFTFR